MKKQLNKISAWVMALIIAFQIIPMTVYAAENSEIPTNAEDITELSSGDYIYRIDNTYYFYDVLQDDTLVLVERNYESVSRVATTVSHTHRDLRPLWIWWHTDGPTQVSINMSAVNHVFRATADWTEVAIALGIAAGVLQWAYEAANGNFNYNQIVWQIDDAYHFYNDMGYQRVDSFFYADSDCTDCKGEDSYTYYTYW